MISVLKTRVFKEREREEVRNSSDVIFEDLEFGGGSELCTYYLICVVGLVTYTAR